jgi:hypothetical protein
MTQKQVLEQWLDYYNKINDWYMIMKVTEWIKKGDL